MLSFYIFYIVHSPYLFLSFYLGKRYRENLLFSLSRCFCILNKYYCNPYLWHSPPPPPPTSTFLTVAQRSSRGRRSRGHFLFLQKKKKPETIFISFMVKYLLITEDGIQPHSWPSLKQVASSIAALVALPRLVSVLN